MYFPEKKNKDDKEMFDEVVKTILKLLGDDVVKIILYGSVARGDNTWESDVDIAVLTRRKIDEFEEDKFDRTFSKLDLKHDTLFSIKMIEENYFNIWKSAISLYGNIEKEGIILWTKE